MAYSHEHPNACTSAPMYLVRVVRQARYFVFQLAEVAVARYSSPRIRVGSAVCEDRVADVTRT
jgi:hypothetical protein